MLRIEFLHMVSTTAMHRDEPATLGSRVQPILLSAHERRVVSCSFFDAPAHVRLTYTPPLRKPPDVRASCVSFFAITAARLGWIETNRVV